MENQNKKYIIPIVMMFALFFMISFVTGLQNPMAVIVKNQFEISNFLSQLGNFANFIAYLCMGIPAGIMLQKIGYKKTALTAIVVGFVGVGISYLSGLISSFPVYLCGAFVSGFSMCMLNTVVNPMLNTLGGGGARGNQLLQIGGCCNSIGATIVPVLVGAMIGDAARARISDATPALFLAMGIFFLAFLVLFFMNIPEPHLQHNDDKKQPHSPYSFRHFNLGIIAIFIYVGVEVGIPNIMNLFLTSQETVGGLAIDAAVAGTVVGTYWFLMLVGRFIGAAVAAKFTSKHMLVFTTVCASILVLLAIFMPQTMVNMPVFKSDISFGLAEVPVNVIFLVLCGLCTSVMWGSIFNLAVEGLGKYTARASGIFMMMVCGGGLLPLLQGFVADKVGFMSSYFVVLAGVIYMLWYAIFGSKNVNKDIPVE